jgi:hypothetical protein
MSIKTHYHYSKLRSKGFLVDMESYKSVMYAVNLLKMIKLSEMEKMIYLKYWTTSHQQFRKMRLYIWNYLKEVGSLKDTLQEK